MLTAQLLGLMHGIVHGPQAGRHAHGHQPMGELQALLASAHRHVHAGHGHDQDHGDGEPSGGKLAALFDGHDSEGDCRLFDQASHGQGAATLAAAFLPMALCTAVFDLSRGEALARWAALFDARGPPRAA